MLVVCSCHGEPWGVYHRPAEALSTADGLAVSDGFSYIRVGESSAVLVLRDSDGTVAHYGDPADLRTLGVGVPLEAAS